MTIHQFTYTGSHNKQSTADITYNEHNTKGRIVLLLHGFKSFKDWGCWPWVAEQLALNGHVVVKINFSHNGTTVQDTQNFADLQAFGDNNFSIQLQDISSLLAQLPKNLPNAVSHLSLGNLCCIGHSMGGGIAILAAARHECITSLITLNSMSDLGKLITRFNAQQWQSEGVVYEYNARTQQQMPLHYQLLLDYEMHKDELNIAKAAQHIRCPWLWVYASKDETVNPTSVHDIVAINAGVQLLNVLNTGHTFGATHPFVAPTPPLQQVIAAITMHLAS